MARRIRLIKPDKQQKVIWSTPGGLSLFIILCVMMVVLIQMLRAPGFFGMMTPKEPANAPASGQSSPTETMQAKQGPTRPKTPPKAHVPLSAKEEETLLASVVDQDPLEAKPYFYLLAKVNALSADQINAAVDPKVTYGSFVDNPAAVRGKFVRLEGLLLRLKETKIRDSLTSGFDSVWEGNMMDNDLRPTAFVMTQPPPPNWFRPRDDTVILKGAFLKNIVYKDRGGAFTASPFIVAKELVKVVYTSSKASFWSRYKEHFIILAIVVIVVGGVFILQTWRVKAAVGSLSRRRPTEPLEVVPEESAVGREESAEQSQHVNPGPTEEKPSEKESEAGKKSEDTSPEK